MSGPAADADALAALLEVERRLILGGRYDELGRLQDEKDRLAAGLEAVSPTAIARLRARADANLALLEAARAGLSAAQTRLRELERLARGGTGYDRRGAPVDAGADPRTSRRV